MKVKASKFLLLNREHFYENFNLPTMIYGIMYMYLVQVWLTVCGRGQCWGTHYQKIPWGAPESSGRRE